MEQNVAENDSCKEEEGSAGYSGYILTALKTDDEIGYPEEKEVTIIEEIAEVLDRRHKEKLPALRDVPKKKTTKFCVSLKHIALQRPTNYFMQELLLLQIGCE